MYFLFSGEGPTDLGTCKNQSNFCQGSDYKHGPMAVMVDQIFEAKFHYSFIELTHYGYVSKSTITGRKSELNRSKNKLKLAGAKRPRETMYFYNNARLLARIAQEKAKELKDDVVAVLFRDTDITNSSGPGIWSDKFQSVLNGFNDEGFKSGVPMIPKPISEAWILCGLKHKHQGCNSLEKQPGSNKSPNSLKQQLKKHNNNRSPTRKELNEMVEDREVDVDQLGMPSFTTFKKRLEEVFRNI